MRKQHKQVSKKNQITITKENTSTTIERKESFLKKEYVLIILLLVITTIVFFPSLFNGFVTNWDDSGYIHEHKPIHEINWENLKIIFTTYHKGNYHPLTLLTYALEYSLVKLKPFLYHFNNLLLHLFNVWLVYIFIKKLSGKSQIAFITALFFGIHPMRVESVAWISERKDVLYTFFFFISANFYINYVEKQDGKIKNFLLSILFIILSLLSKPAAVCFPGVVVLIDWIKNRKFDIKVILEKIPFFVLSVIFGIIAIFSQEEAGAIQNLTPIFSFFERILLSFYALVRYLEKLVLPLHLSAMHPYPNFVDGRLPIVVYISPLIIAILFVIVLLTLRRTKVVAFGAAFFLVNIALVLQLLPVGAAIIAERYSYVPYIGLFFIVGHYWYFVNYHNSVNVRKWGNVFTGFLIIIGIFWSYLTIDRIKVWERGDILFEDVVRKYNNINFAYNNLGYFYQNELKNYDKALYNYNRCLQVDSTFHMAYSNRAILLYNLGKIEEALKDFNKALKYKPDNTDALLGRANTLSTLERYKEAIPDYTYYLKLKPKDANAWMWRGIAYNKIEKLDSALSDLNISLNINDSNAQAYYWRGLTWYKKNEFDKALNDLNKATQIKPDYSEVFAWKGYIYSFLKKYNESIIEYSKAISIKPDDIVSYVNRSVCYKEIGDYRKAFEDIEKARLAGYPVVPSYYEEVKAKALK